MIPHVDLHLFIVALVAFSVLFGLALGKLARERQAVA